MLVGTWEGRWIFPSSHRGEGRYVVLSDRGKHCSGGMVTNEALRSTARQEILIRKQREAARTVHGWRVCDRDSIRLSVLRTWKER